MARFYGGAEETEGMVSVWLQIDDSHADVFEEQYDDEDAPMSPFSEAFEFYYDHDYLESDLQAKAQPVEGLLENYDGFSKEVLAAAKQQKITKAYGIVVLFDHVYQKEIQEALGFVYLGAFANE